MIYRHGNRSKYLRILSKHRHIPCSAKYLFIQKGRKKNQIPKLILKTIQRDVEKYRAMGLRITDIHRDNDSKNQSIIDALGPISYHISTKDEHVGVITNKVKTVKERKRVMCNPLPYRRYTALMTRSLVGSAVDLLKIFPSINGISKKKESRNYYRRKREIQFRREEN